MRLFTLDEPEGRWLEMLDVFFCLDLQHAFDKMAPWTKIKINM